MFEPRNSKEPALTCAVPEMRLEEFLSILNIPALTLRNSSSVQMVKQASKSQRAAGAGENHEGNLRTPMA